MCKIMYKSMTLTTLFCPGEEQKSHEWTEGGTPSLFSSGHRPRVLQDRQRPSAVQSIPHFHTWTLVTQAVAGHR